MVNKEQITNLLQHFAGGTISKEEYTELISYFNLTGNDEEIFAAMDEIWKTMDPELWHSEKEVEQIYQNLISQPEFNATPPAVPVRKLWYRIAAAAVFFISIAAGLYFYQNRYKVPASERFANQDIAPGGNKAILTLSNGKKINLNAAGTGKLANESGISISKTKSGQLIYTIVGNVAGDHQDHGYNTITTPRGGQYQVNLPDGTTVWLNAASSLKFPVQFSTAERKVTLSGEAYFEVAKIKSTKVINGKQRLPFIVETGKQEVMVLGTHFNINAYEANTKTTLLEGAVSVSSLRSTANPKPLVSYLQPGQESDLRGTAIKVSMADVEQTMAWKNGFFLFSNQDLQGIMREVERWYDVDVVFEENSLKTQNFSGTISRFKNISQLLEVLESTGSVHFKMQGRRITAMK